MCSNFLPQYVKDVFDYITWIEENHNIVESSLTQDVIKKKKKNTNIWRNIPRASKHLLCFLDYFCDINLANICFYFICRKVGGDADSCSKINKKPNYVRHYCVFFFFLPEKYSFPPCIT